LLWINVIEVCETSLTELFRIENDRCEICKTDIKDSSIESHGKNFCSIECMQEYLIRLKEAELKMARKETRQMKF